MSAEDRQPGRRSEPRVWLYTEHWLWGSTRSEYTIEERAVFVDLLCLGITGLGRIDITYPDQTADQLRVPHDVFNSTIEKGIKYGKFAIRRDRKRKKAFLYIENWTRYQPEYLHERPGRSLKGGQKPRIAKAPLDDAHRGAIVNSIVEDSKVEERSNTGEAHFNTKFEFLKRLRILEEEFEETPDDSRDEGFYNFILSRYRSLDPIREIDAIRELFKKNPGEVKTRIVAGKSLHDQLHALFETAAKYAGLKE